jgi:hypothetical protein
MKRILLLVFILTSVLSQAQNYNNEWIDYNKTYYKFKVATTGLYRISVEALASIGLSNANADHFQLWRNGVEVPLYTTSQNAPLSTGGYIEFWGEMNDGLPDKPLYRQPEWQLNERASLQTDTSVYYLTINSAGNNRRLVTTVNDVAGNTLPAEPYLMYTVETNHKIRINPGRAELVGTSYTYSSSYDYGEGYTSAELISGGASYAAVYSLMRPYTGAGAPDPEFRIHASGNTVNPRYFRVLLNNDSLMGPTMDYFDYVKATQTFPISKIAATGSLSINVSNRSAVSGDRMVMHYMSVTYPRLFNFNAASVFSFSLPATAVGNFLVIDNFQAVAGTYPVLYDLTNGKRYVATTTTAPFRFRIDPSATTRQLILVNQSPSNFKAIGSFEQRDFINYGDPSNQGDFLIITNQVLTGLSGGADPVEDYRQYRSSAQGGGYAAKVYLIDQLEDQFAFGIKMHPLSIRNFVRWARNTYSNPVKDVLLIGKGVIYSQFRTNESNPNIKLLSLVPTFGNPASDNLLTAEGSSSMPLTPIGRISAISKDEVYAYLAKLKEYEQLYNFSSPVLAEKGWMKNIIHVVGAGDNNTSSLLTAALEGQKKIIEDSLYAGNVHTFSKTSADAVQQVASVRLNSLFKEGVGVLTYFGHSSSNALEFNLDNPQAYDNPGKYPVFIVMGCNAGSFYNYNVARLSTKETISEKYVLAEGRGAVAFMASTHLGIIHYLDIYNTRNYRAMSQTQYGKTLGETMDEAIRQTFALTTENDFYARFQCEQFTLHGDPAVKYYTSPKPDYVIEDAMVSVDPKYIPVSETEFRVTAKFANLGRSLNRSVVVELKRTYPNHQVEVIKRDTIIFKTFQDSLVYTLPVISTRDKGLNKISVTIDPENQIDELYETNNSVTRDVYIIEEDIRPVSPYPYSIINQQGIKLAVSTANPFSTNHTYMMEIDTTEDFNSSLKVIKTVQAPGGYIEFTPGITFTDSTVYYWRVAAAVSVGEPVWHNSSFQYIANSGYGFSQAHYFQHKESNGSHIRVNENREWVYDSIVNNLFIKNGVWGSAVTTSSELAVNVNDSSYIRNTCTYGFVFNIFDQKTFKPWVNQVVGSTGLYNSVAPCDATNRRYNFEFPNTPAGRQNALLFLRAVPEGNFVVLRNQIYQAVASNEYAAQWLADEATYGVGNSLYTELKTQGFTDIDSINRPRAFSFAYKKNGAGSLQPKFIISEGIFDAINLSVDCVTPRSIGYITSPVLGPAKEWQKLYWNGRTIDPDLKDSPTIDVIGIDRDGVETDLIGNIDLSNQEVDISAIDAVQYPNIKLRMANQDTIHYTPYQLRYWIVNYVPIPEGAIAPNLYFTTKDTVEVGEPVNFGIGFKNVSPYSFDSVKVKLTITDKNNIENIVPVPRQKKLNSGDTIQLQVPVDTRSLSGINTLFVNFNPDSDQPEQYLLNNYAFRTLYVRPDSLDPLLDVTFDGIHILNRDIVAAKPIIVAELKDEAKWMLLNDTSVLNVSVRYPDGTQRRFNFDNDTLQFIPATQSGATGNTAKINFKPYFLQDGDYELVVSGKDRSENLAGAVQYRVAFQVINKPMISNMLNYPNPFTTSTAFVFTITGAEIPQNIRIQILTITGKVVREITRDELGPLHIGRNITEFKWDGTDQYGQKLANGIYLYRVVTNLNGKSLDKYKAEGDNTDKYFNKGYGKMYLMR